MKKLLLILFIPSISFASCKTSDVLPTIRPGAQWAMNNNDLSTLVWLSTQTVPTQSEVNTAISACLTTTANNIKQMQNDIFNVKLSTNTAATKLSALIDFLQLKGQLQQ